MKSTRSPEEVRSPPTPYCRHLTFAPPRAEGIDRGVHGVFDGVGKDTFDSDFDLVRRKGTIVTCGNASGPVPPFAPLKLGPKNLKGACSPLSLHPGSFEIL